jgi:hypothetical protein
VAVDPERDSALQYFEDISVGQKETAGPIELTKEEIMEFSRRWDPQPFHVDEAAAQRSTFGGVTAAECHVFCIAAKLTHDLRRVALIAVSGRNFTFPIEPQIRVAPEQTLSPRPLSPHSSHRKPYPQIGPINAHPVGRYLGLASDRAWVEPPVVACD